VEDDSEVGGGNYEFRIGRQNIEADRKALLAGSLCGVQWVGSVLCKL